MIKARLQLILIMVLTRQREQVLVEGLWGRVQGGNMDKNTHSKGLGYLTLGRLWGWSLMMNYGDVWCFHRSYIIYLIYHGSLSISHTQISEGNLGAN
jgi:hypothetical protein